MTITPLHVSHSVHHGDGGIAFAIADLMAAQQKSGTYARWLSSDRYTPLMRDSQLKKAVISSKANVLHVHGLWRSQTRIAAKLLKQSYPLIVAPHGMMDEWAMAHSSWKKEIVWRLWEGNVLSSVKCLHALCNAEASAIHKRLPGQPVAVIPNGVNLPVTHSYPKSLTPWAEEIPDGDKVLLFLGRFHQKKGLEPLMTAWQSVIEQARQSGWWLVFIGFGDDGKFESQLKAFPVERCLAYGALFDEHKVAAFQNASAFILPSYSEGLPMAALEAMSYGLPCLLSSACNLPEAFAVDAALPAEPESSSLIQSLKSFFLLSDSQRLFMGSEGKRLTQQQFHWDKVAEMTIDLYRWVLGEAEVPYFVRFSADN